MHQFRVTKYNPAYRDRTGAYRRDEWISYSDIGRTIGGETLTRSAYQEVEDAYVDTALAFLGEAGIGSLRVCGLENQGAAAFAPADGACLDLARLGAAIRDVLRETYWCRFEAENAYVHIGYDFYMYVGVPEPCDDAQRAALEQGLFVERFVSPHLGGG